MTKHVSRSMIDAFQRWKKEHESQIKDLRFTLHLLRRSPLSMAGLAIVIAVVLMSIFAPLLGTHNPEEVNVKESNLPPGTLHFFGTDERGMDIYSRTVYGARLDLSIGIVVIGVSVVSGMVVGAIAGYKGGKLDELLMRVTDVFLAIPGLILAMAVSAALGERSLRTMMISLTIVWWPYYARILRGSVVSIREEPYVEAARSLGGSDLHIVFRHILPNCLAPVIVAATMDMGYVLLLAAGLSFLGFGAQAGVPEWGRMIADGRSWIQSSPWMVIFPGMALLITALGFNLLGDGLRDVLDPRLRR